MLKLINCQKNHRPIRPTGKLCWQGVLTLFLFVVSGTLVVWLIWLWFLE